MLEDILPSREVLSIQRTIPLQRFARTDMTLASHEPSIALKSLGVANLTEMTGAVGSDSKYLGIDERSRAYLGARVAIGLCIGGRKIRRRHQQRSLGRRHDVGHQFYLHHLHW